MVADCVLEPRSSVTANAAIGKMKHLRKVLPYKCPGLAETDQLFGAIFGEKGLGMPLHGSDKNDVNLNAYVLQKFQIENYSPERMIVGGIGIENHGEFVTMVEEHFANIRYGSQLHTPEKQVFQEAELKIADPEVHKNQVLLLFESVPNSAKEFLVSALVREYFGAADVNNPAIQNTNNGVFMTDFYNKEKSIHSAEALNFHFNDVGLLGFRLTTTSDGSNRALDALANHLQKLDQASEIHFVQAVKRLRHSIIDATENPCSRLKELLTQVSVFGESRLDQLLSEIDKLTISDLTSFLRKTIGGKGALLVRGPNVGGVHALSEFKKLLGK
jgi:predicted Zn-dependent peptidase